MVDLLQSQIKESCQLALPNGLKELMSDISREVLRTQPTNLYGFITSYLSALLVTRENLSIAAKVCEGVCHTDCYPELQDELRYVGLTEEDATNAEKIIMKYFEIGGTNEGTLISKLVKKLSIKEDQLEEVQEAVQRAFIRHQINNTVIYESSSNSDDVMQAAHHTLDLYRKTMPTDGEYHQNATRIQAAYRAYGVRRLCPRKDSLSEKKDKNKKAENKKNIRFRTENGSSSEGSSNEVVDKEESHTTSCPIRTVSSTTLAGSHMSLPKYVPYSVHERLENLDEVPEKENVTIDYVEESLQEDNGYETNYHDTKIVRVDVDTGNSNEEDANNNNKYYNSITTNINNDDQDKTDDILNENSDNVVNNNEMQSSDDILKNNEAERSVSVANKNEPTVSGITNNYNDQENTDDIPVDTVDDEAQDADDESEYSVDKDYDAETENYNYDIE